MQFFHQQKQAYELRFRNALDFPSHLHNALELVWLRRGSCQIQWDTDSFTLQPGQLFMAFPNRLHGYENSRDVDAVLWIIPVQPFLTPYQTLLERSLPQSPVIQPDVLENENIPQLLELAMADRQQASPQVMQSYIRLVVGKLLGLLPLQPVNTGNADALQSVLLYLNDHYRESLTRQEIADAVGYNASYISHIFTDTLHTTLTDYLTGLRLAEAMQLLQSTRTPVGRIALELGFGSIRSFNRIFLKKTGYSPSQFRK